MELISVQILLSLCLSGITIFVGLLPVTLLRALTRNANNNRRISYTLTLLSCFAGGVILATCFLDIFPHVNHNYEKYRREYEWKITFPLPQFTACLGFFLVYFIEEMIMKVFASDGEHFHSHGHGGGQEQHNHHHHPHENRAKGVEAKEPALREPLNPQTGDAEKHQSNGKLDDEIRKSSRHSLNIHDMLVDECGRQIVAENESSSNTSFLKSLTFALAMSFHSVLEGFALGVQEDKTGAITLFCSLMVDNAIDAFTVGLQVGRSNSKKLYLLVTTIIVYACMSPLGSFLGIILTNASLNPQYRDLAIILFESIAAGTFIYMTFLEILAHERENEHSNLSKLGAIIVGFTCISLLQVNEHFGEGGGHSH